MLKGLHTVVRPLLASAGPYTAQMALAKQPRRCELSHRLITQLSRSSRAPEEGPTEAMKPEHGGQQACASSMCHSPPRLKLPGPLIALPFWAQRHSVTSEIVSIWYALLRLLRSMVTVEATCIPSCR